MLRQVANHSQAVANLVAEYRETYAIAKQHDRPQALMDAAKIELGIRSFLKDGGFGAFTDTFEDLHGRRSSHRIQPGPYDSAYGGLCRNRRN